MKTFTREIVSYWELPEEWQKEAKSNLDSQAEDSSFLMPLDSQNPKEHILWDLSECMRTESDEMDGVIPISNNSALAVKISEEGTKATCWYL